MNIYEESPLSHGYVLVNSTLPIQLNHTDCSKYVFDFSKPKRVNKNAPEVNKQ